VPVGEFWYFNRDGARTPVFAPQPSEGPNGYWGGVALIPSDSCDVDLTLYELSTGPQDGFDDPVATSSWGTGELDFVMVNFNQDPLNFRALDAGYYKAQGEDDFWTEVSYSSFMGYYPLLETGPFGMPGNGRMLNMHEVWLDPGDYQVQLQNLDGTVDYGISAYAGPEDMWFGKSDYIEGAISWFSGPGADESFNLHAETSGMYLIAVWKRGLSELFKNGVYNLFVEGGVVDAPEVPLVTTTTLRDASPNPFNPRTTIHFDLAQAGPVDLSIYDLRGALVRQLADGRHYEPGNHGIVWDGTDRSGRTVASGTYFVLMEAGGVRYQKKVTLIK
jgi:hypothetical protein